jgi:murein DD-endopeptidase MepM/ murein hydrolase activator NlpD
MLIAIVLSLIPSCFVSTGTAAAIVRQDLPETRLSYGSARNLHREAAELPPTASLPRPTEPLSQNKFYIGDTGHYINGAFLNFWRQHGQTAVLGNPLSEEFVQNGRTVQLFDKALLESHPEETEAANQVQLGFLGRQLADARGLHFDPAASTASSPTRTYFNETGQAISGNFKTFWEKNNGLTLLGLPIGPELQEAGTTVQYFERGVLQLKANSNTTVEIASSGNALLEALDWPRPTGLNLELNIGENEIYQGRTLGIRLSPDFSWSPLNLKGNIGDEALKILQVGEVYKSLKSFAPSADTKAYPLNLFYTDPAGRDREIDRTINVVKYDFPLQNLYLPDDKTALTDKANDDYDNAQLAQAYATYTPTIMWNGVWNWPAFGPISTEFAAMRAYGDSTDYDKYHGGLDISLPLGTPAAAPADGKVIYTGLLKARGNTVALDHGMGVTSYYFHLNAILVKPGDMLKKGQILGLVGTTGRSTGPHLHWEVRVNGTITYPLLFVNYDMSR